MGLFTATLEEPEEAWTVDEVDAVEVDEPDELDEAEGVTPGY